MSKLDNRQVMGQENLVGERSRTRSAKAKSASRWIAVETDCSSPQFGPTNTAQSRVPPGEPALSAVPETRLMMQTTWSQWAACEQCIWTRNNRTQIEYYTILKQKS